jgi:RNA polymerase sigma-70 factor (ECF subfamily)
MSGGESEDVPNDESQYSDSRLMRQLRDGSAAAMEDLVAKHQGRVLAALEHLVHNRVLAEDLSQEVFLRVFRARRTQSFAIVPFWTWLSTIINNVASQHRSKDGD